jgi:hypothetical protein
MYMLAHHPADAPAGDPCNSKNYAWNRRVTRSSSSVSAVFCLAANDMPGPSSVPAGWKR